MVLSSSAAFKQINSMSDKRLLNCPRSASQNYLHPLPLLSLQLLERLFFPLGRVLDVGRRRPPLRRRPPPPLLGGGQEEIVPSLLRNHERDRRVRAVFFYGRLRLLFLLLFRGFSNFPGLPFLFLTSRAGQVEARMEF